MNILKRTRIITKKNLLLYWWGMQRIKFGHIGNNTRICNNSTFYNSQNIYLEDNVFLATQNYMDAAYPIVIKSGVMIGPKCTFISGNHNYNSSDLKSIPYDNRLTKTDGILIEENVWIAANVMICPGTHIGEGAVIGAGCCVHGYIPPYSIIGAPLFKELGKRDIGLYNELKSKQLIYNLIYAGTEFEKY